MHRETILAAIGFVLAGAAAGVTGQNAIAPGHDRVPPYSRTLAVHQRG